MSTTGSDSGDGSKDHPFKTIQAALNIAIAQGDTAVMVEAGAYHENVTFGKSTNVSPDHPVWLVSADGQGAANIIGANPLLPVVGGWGIHDVGIFNFELTANSSTDRNAADAGGIKFTQGGTDYTNMSSNIIISGNIVDGHGIDGIKLAQTANAIVVGNTVNGNFAEEAFDNVTVLNSLYADNTTLGIAQNSGMTFKAGSQNLEILDNHIASASADGIIVGGRGLPNSSTFTAAIDSHQEASNVMVQGNVIQNAGLNGIDFMGAINSTAQLNYIANTLGGSNIVSARSSLALSDGSYFNSHDNTVIGNTVSHGDKGFKASSGQDAGFNVAGNAADTLDHFLATHTPSTSFSANDVYNRLDGDAVKAGTAHNDVLAGTSQADTISGMDGDDRINALDGNDVVHGGNGNDAINGGAGNDTLYGDGGADTLQGGNDKDVLYGGDGDDRLDGMSNNDIVYGGAGNDTITAGHGSDQVWGGAGADTFVIQTQYEQRTFINDFSLSEGDRLVFDQLLQAPSNLDTAIGSFVSMADSKGGMVLSIDRDGAASEAKLEASIVFVGNHDLTLKDLVDHHAVTLAMHAQV